MEVAEAKMLAVSSLPGQVEQYPLMSGCPGLNLSEVPIAGPEQVWETLLGEPPLPSV